MRYIFLATILSGLLILGMFGLRGHKFNETPVEIFPDMDRQDRINAQSRSDFFADGIGSRKPVNGTVPIGFSIPEVAANEGDAILDGCSLQVVILTLDKWEIILVMECQWKLKRIKLSSFAARKGMEFIARFAMQIQVTAMVPFALLGRTGDRFR